MWPHPLGNESRGIARSDTETEKTREHPVFEYELQRMNHAELIRQAAAERLSHEAAEAAGATRGLRLFGRRHGNHGTEGQVDGGERGRFVRAA